VVLDVAQHQPRFQELVGRFLPRVLQLLDPPGDQPAVGDEARLLFGSLGGGDPRGLEAGLTGHGEQ